ncbi:Fatty acid-binding protein, intestinal [Varanus komodoensis]|uniref:Fatty acid binding protein 2 n=1 Tax=Varanus komodoensis TaxID=61221 RepID=A0A8D2L8A7_VARKO|nr:fatty acid-binding protein, intestinal [Varanus komodoensis]KAF7252484.1 Fatty acid-binding protein, intestinal [Varanus komodoensis]
MAFDGTWKVEKSENYDKFMEVMGINIVKRKLGAHDNLKITIQQEGNKFTVKESSTFRNIDIVFNLGENFDYSLADGTELHGQWNMEGNKLVGAFTRKDNGKVLKAVREITGDEMVQTYTYEGVEAKRFFKKA